MTGPFWTNLLQKNHQVTIPLAFRKSEETGRIKNFEVAGGLKQGTFCTKYGFDDSDVFKIIEGASYALAQSPDPELDALLDSLIIKIAAAQEPDGYLYTNRTIMGDSALEMAGPDRWVNVHEHSHELYNAGHLYEAAVAHYLATGKRTLLDVALKNADLVRREFGWGKREDYPGHQEIEIGLVKLYRVSGDQKYLDQARFFLDVRGPGGWEYNQAHEKPVNQKEAVGHAVRALYMYSAMTDIAALTGDKDYLEAVLRLWDDVAGRKMYVTGGVGQKTENEGFGPAFELPSASAYCETCASIAFVLWNHRMFLLTGNSMYYDLIERTLLNALLAGINISGDRFFYPNPLSSDGTYHRKEWFGCACCPSNLTRFLSSLPGLIYAQTDTSVFINLYYSSRVDMLSGNQHFSAEMISGFPSKGDVNFKIIEAPSVPIQLCFRIPGWAWRNSTPGGLYEYLHPVSGQWTVRINGTNLHYTVKDGYAIISRTWKPGDVVSVSFPMEIRAIEARKEVSELSGKVAFSCGPFVYCCESVDYSGRDVRNLCADGTGNISVLTTDTIFNGRISALPFANLVLYTESGSPLPGIAIPYAFWDERTPGPMTVWVDKCLQQ
ncbi:MAG: glycoside hydrolase family 127 protein [Bacteroidales bacterium]